MQDFAYKISKIFRGLYPPTPLAGGGDPLPAPSPRSAYGLARGRFAPPAPQTQTSWQVPPPTGSRYKSHPAADFSVSNRRHGCHPYAAALSPSVMAGTSFTHVFPLPASAATYLTYVAPSLPAWCRPSANNAAVGQRPASRPHVARVVRVSVAPRARHVRRSRFHHQQMGVVF
jgi:hypothetical protein